MKNAEKGKKKVRVRRPTSSQRGIASKTGYVV